MKKILIIFILSIILFSLAGCGTLGPEDTVDKYFTAAQKLDLISMAANIAPSNTEDRDKTSTLFEGEEQEEFQKYAEDYLKTNARKMTYKITGSEENGDKAVVTVDCKYVDFGRILKATVGEMFAKLFGQTFSGVEMTDEENEQMFLNVMKEQIKTFDETFIEVTLNIDLVKIENTWYIAEASDELLDVVASGFISAFEELIEPTSNLSELHLSLAPVLQGQGIPDAAEFNPETPGPHLFIILDASGNVHLWNKQIPPEWVPINVYETELVVVIEDRIVPLDSQAYIGGPSITSYRRDIDILIREARTGEILISSTMEGPNPAPFPINPPKEQTKMYGGEVEYDDFQNQFLDEYGLKVSYRSQCWDTEFTKRLSNGALSPQGQLIASISGGYQDSIIITLWRVTNGVLLHKLTGTAAAMIDSIVFSPDGQILAVGLWNGGIDLWQISDGSLLYTLKGHKDRVEALAFSSDGQFLASGGWTDDYIQVWQIIDGTLVTTIEESAAGLAFSPDGELLASVAPDGSVRLWRVFDGNLVSIPFDKLGNRFTSLSFSPNGQLLASASNEYALIQIWRVSDGVMLQTIQGNKNPDARVASIAFSQDGKLLASGSDAEISLWQVADGTLQDMLWRHNDVVTNLYFSSDGESLISGSKDTICLWTIKD